MVCTDQITSLNFISWFTVYCKSFCKTQVIVVEHLKGMCLQGVCLRAKAKTDSRLKVCVSVWGWGADIKVNDRAVTSPDCSRCEWMWISHTDRASHTSPSVFQPPTPSYRGFTLSGCPLAPSSHSHSIMSRATQTMYTLKLQILEVMMDTAFLAQFADLICCWWCLYYNVPPPQLFVLILLLISSLFGLSSSDTWAMTKSTSFGQNIPETTAGASSRLSLETC